MYRAKITAISYHVPLKVVTNNDLAKVLDTSDEWISSRTGIKERHFAARGEATSDLAAAAAPKLLKRRRIGAKDIDCIIVATVTPDMLFPSTACVLQEKIGASNAWGFDLSGACSGFLYALATGSQFVHTGAYSKVLVVGADTMTSILDPRDRNTYILFGDAAGCVLLEPTGPGERGIIDFLLKCDGSGGKHLRMPGGGSLHPASYETVRRNMHVVHQDGRVVFKYAVQGMSDVAEAILSRNHMRASDVDLFVPHQANIRIIDAVAEKLGMDSCRVVRNIDRFANTTAATIPIGLGESYNKGLLQRGDVVLLATFGAGFTAGSLLLRWTL
jgi:3-oxoacyl-[acyl-carrier-protein] synthase-3